jgi:two-component system, chemotaxis family, sensor kinase CheA
MSPKVDLSEFVTGFLAEADDLLALASSSLLAVEAAGKKGSASPRAVRDAFRALHTIKGLSAMVGVEPVVAIAHRMETSLRVADQAGGKLGPEAVDALLKGVRAIQQRVRALAEGAAPAEAPRTLLDALDALETGGGAHPEGAPLAVLELDPRMDEKLSRADREQLMQGIAAGKLALCAEFTPSAERAAAGASITTVREQLGKRAEIVKVLPIGVPSSPEAPGGLAFLLLLLSSAGPEELQQEMAHAGLAVRLVARAQPGAEIEPVEDDGAARTGLVRVQVSRLDDAMERLSALIVTRFRLARAVSEMAEQGADVRKLNQIVAENARQLRDLRAAVLQVRMVRVSEVLERVPLLVRGLRRNTGKLVRLEMDTGRAEVDKAVAERLFPAIVHLVRNSVDHGIEPPDERRAKGKPEEALLRLTCIDRSNNQLELTVADDGRGIDAAAVATKAGKPAPEGNAALLDLLCTPGFSTRDQATATSGRGMGMDIARRIAVDELGGEMFLETEVGKGSRFILRVPLTVTIVDAFVFEAAGQRYAVPVSTVEEIFELDVARATRTPALRGKASLVQRRGEALPVVQLASLLRVEDPGVAAKALVIRRGGEPMGFAVQRMIGQQEVVIRPLEDPLVRVPGITGATDLGDGKPTLVLDLATLGSHALAREAA